MKISLYLVFLSAFCFCSATHYSQSGAQPMGTQVTPASPDFDVPAIVGSHFSALYANIRPVWRKRDEAYVAVFTDPSTHQKTEITFDRFGNQLFTDRIVEEKKLPKKLKTHLSQAYPDSSITVWQRQRDQDIHYYSLNKNDTTVYSEQGMVMPRKK